MSDFFGLANEDRARQARSMLASILAGVNRDIGDFSPVLDAEKGRVTITSKGKELTFTIINRTLRMIGPCPVCIADVPSKRVGSMSDIGSLLERFVPDKHDCLDMDS